MELLRVDWLAGVTTSEIGRRHGWTKGQISGAVKRHGLPARPSPIGNGGVQTRRVKRPTGERPRVVRNTLEPVGDPLPHGNVYRWEQLALDRVTPTSPPIAVKPMAAGCCVFPMWGHRERPTHRYCGAATERGGYCGAHYAVCYTRPAGMSVPMVGV